MLQSNVQIGTDSAIASRFVVFTCSWVEPAMLFVGSPVNGKIKNVRVVVGQFLNPIAMLRTETSAQESY